MQFKSIHPAVPVLVSLLALTVSYGAYKASERNSETAAEALKLAKTTKIIASNIVLKPAANKSDQATVQYQVENRGLLALDHFSVSPGYYVVNRAVGIGLTGPSDVRVQPGEGISASFDLAGIDAAGKPIPQPPTFAQLTNGEQHLVVLIRVVASDQDGENKKICESFAYIWQSSVFERRGDCDMPDWRGKTMSRQ